MTSILVLDFKSGGAKIVNSVLAIILVTVTLVSPIAVILFLRKKRENLITE